MIYKATGDREILAAADRALVTGVNTHKIGRIVGKRDNVQAEQQGDQQGEGKNFSQFFHALCLLFLRFCKRPSIARARKTTPLTTMAA